MWRCVCPLQRRCKGLPMLYSEHLGFFLANLFFSWILCSEFSVDKRKTGSETLWSPYPCPTMDSFHSGEQPFPSNLWTFEEYDRAQKPIFRRTKTCFVVVARPLLVLFLPLPNTQPVNDWVNLFFASKPASRCFACAVLPWRQSVTASLTRGESGQQPAQHNSMLSERAWVRLGCLPACATASKSPLWPGLLWGCSKCSMFSVLLSWRMVKEQSGN